MSEKMGMKIEELIDINSVYFDGYGEVALDQAGVKWLQECLDNYFEEAFPPHVYPTPEGKIQFEWDVGPFRADLEINLHTRVGEWHCLDIGLGGTDERELQLYHSYNWVWLIKRLRYLQKFESKRVVNQIPNWKKEKQK